MNDTSVLSDNWLRRAQRLNPYYQQRLGWSVPDGWPTDVASEDFAESVAFFQKEHGALTVDGIAGPKTAAAFKGLKPKPPDGEFLLVGGQRVAVPFPVVTWEEPNGMSFYGHGGWTKRRDPSGKGVSLFVLHWDGCTSARQCFHVLLERGLSVHLMLDGDGTVYQALDLAEARAWHAGDVNERSIGVEIQNPVQLHRNKWQTPPREVVVDPGVHGGPTYEHLDFYDGPSRARRPARRARRPQTNASQDRAPGCAASPSVATVHARGAVGRARGYAVGERVTFHRARVTGWTHASFSCWSS